MTRVILQRSAEEAYAVVDRAVRPVADQVERTVTGWSDWSPAGIALLLSRIIPRIRRLWLVTLPLALLEQMDRVRQRILLSISDASLRGRVGRTLGSGVPSDAPARLARQEAWVVANVARIIRTGSREQQVAGEVVAPDVARFLHPRFAQVRIAGKGTIVRRYPSSGPYAGSFARQLMRDATATVYGETMQAIADHDPEVTAQRWRLASSHVGPDECTSNAQQDRYGLGDGVYPVRAFPPYPSHHGCLCSRDLVRDARRIRSVA